MDGAGPRLTWRIDVVRLPLVQAAGIGRRLTAWWAAYLVVFGIVILSALIITPFVPPLLETDIALVAALAPVLLHVVVIALLFAWVKWYEQRPVRSVGFTEPIGKGDLARGFGVGVGAIALVTIVLLALGAIHLTPTESGPVRWDALLPAAVMVPLWLFLAGVQEALSRGYLLQVGGLQLAAWAAIGGQAVLWAIVRAASAGTTDLLALVNLVLIGMVLAFVALQHGSLWLAVGLQAGWSWFESSVLGVTLAGGPEPDSILSLVPTSGGWWGGGAAGIVASPVITLAMLAAGVFTFRRLLAQPGVAVS